MRWSQRRSTRPSVIVSKQRDVHFSVLPPVDLNGPRPTANGAILDVPLFGGALGVGRNLYFLAAVRTLQGLKKRKRGRQLSELIAERGPVRRTCDIPAHRTT